MSADSTTDASEDTESIALSQHDAFWRLYDRALARAEEEGWTPLEEVLPQP